MVSSGKASSYTLLLLVCGASAQNVSPVRTILNQIKPGLRKGGTRHDTLADACAEAHIPEYSKVAKLCKDLSAGDLDVGVDDSISLGTMGHKLNNEPLSFNMRQILEAEDPEAAYNKIEAAYDKIDNKMDNKIDAEMMKQTERKLQFLPVPPLYDYGWCSTNLFKLLGGHDTANYCNPSQTCTIWPGCGTDLSDCCITHDKCLNNSDGYVENHRCSETDCKGGPCDAQLSDCAWNVSCCSYGVFCDTECIKFSTTIYAFMSQEPNGDQNAEGENTDSVCGDT